MFLQALELMVEDILLLTYDLLGDLQLLLCQSLTDL